MKTKLKYISIIAGATMIGSIFLGSSAFAQTAASSVIQNLIQTLQAQITALQQQLNTLIAAQTQIGAATSTASGISSSTLQLISQLDLGSKGNNVKLLQEILAADSSVYPEGVISGYFGQLTEDAVKRFQQKHGLEQAGRVGPQTLSEINKELENNPVGEQENASGEKEHCAIVPPGHLIAPGWIRKEGGNGGEGEGEGAGAGVINQVIPLCQTIPSGIEQQLSSTTPTSTQTAAPVISGVSVSSVTVNSAQINWTTDKSATSMIWYGTSNSITASGNASISYGDLALSHSVALSGLTANTTYYYIVGSTDSSGNIATSSQNSFMTSAGM